MDGEKEEDEEEGESCYRVTLSAALAYLSRASSFPFSPLTPRPREEEEEYYLLLYTAYCTHTRRRSYSLLRFAPVAIHDP